MRREGNPETLGGIAAYRPWPRNILPRAHFFGYYFRAGDAAMTKDYGNLSREGLARANELSERAIFWSMVLTVLVVVAAMIRGMLG